MSFAGARAYFAVNVGVLFERGDVPLKRFLIYLNVVFEFSCSVGWIPAIVFVSLSRNVLGFPFEEFSSRSLNYLV